MTRSDFTGADGVEVISDEMIEAGRQAYAENFWFEPTDDDVTKLVTEIFRAMLSARHVPQSEAPEHGS